jgi:hypothetical protein
MRSHRNIPGGRSNPAVTLLQRRSRQVVRLFGSDDRCAQPPGEITAVSCAESPSALRSAQQQSARDSISAAGTAQMLAAIPSAGEQTRHGEKNRTPHQKILDPTRGGASRRREQASVWQPRCDQTTVSFERNGYIASVFSVMPLQRSTGQPKGAGSANHTQDLNH